MFHYPRLVERENPRLFIVKISFPLLIIPLVAPSLSSHGAVTSVSRQRDVNAQGRASSMASTDDASSVMLGPFDYVATSSNSADGVFESSSATQHSSFVWSSGELHVSATGGTHASVGGMFVPFDSETQNGSSGSVNFTVDSPTPFILQASVAVSGSYNGNQAVVYLLDNDAAGSPILAYFQDNQSGSASGTLVPNHHTPSFSPRRTPQVSVRSVPNRGCRILPIARLWT